MSPRGISSSLRPCLRSSQPGWRQLVGFLAVVLCIQILQAGLSAHESWPALLEFREQESGDHSVLWRTPMTGGRPSPIGLEIPEAWPEVGTRTERQRDNWVVREFSIRPGDTGLDGGLIRFPGQEGTITDIYVRLYRADGTVFSTVVRPPNPSVTLRGERSWWANTRGYVGLGVQHILLGIDHLLFVLGLILIVRSPTTLLKTITAFTVAHSITLALATLGHVAIPLEPLNAAIALSILFLGPEIVRAWQGRTSLTIEYPWVVAFVFGLLHGFGFASGLSTTGMPSSELPWALLWFNVGVEIGQLGFVALITLVMLSFRRLEIEWPVWVRGIPGYAVGCFGAFWTIDRIAAMLQR